MLSIGKVVDAGYYFSRVADTVEHYYSLQGEAAGYWLGAGAAELGVTGSAEAEQFQRVLDGRHPVTGDQLTMAANRKVLGFDLCFRAPKSVSVLAGLGDADTVAAVRACHDEAVAEAVSFLERHGCAGRRGHNGVESIPGSGFVTVAFRHRTSRAADPHLHTHVLAANLTKGTDGRWSALDGRLLYRLSKTVGSVYEAHLRHAMTRDLGVEWGPVSHGIADVVGIPKPLLRLFSKRRAQIEAAMDKRGYHSARAAEAAALATRQPKGHANEGPDVRDRWRQEASTVGFGQEQLAAVTGCVVEVEPPALEGVIDELCSPSGLTAERSSFTRAYAVRAVCDRLPQGAVAGDIEATAERVVSHPEVVRLTENPSSSAMLAPDYSTRELLAVERRLINRALGGRNAGRGLVNPKALGVALAERTQLSGEQVRLVMGLTTSGHAVDVVAAPAGTGKTFSLEAARAAWTASGYRVVGCSLSARAAAQLESGSGIPSFTIARLLGDLDGGDRLDAMTVVVVDEAGMVGTRPLDRLIGHADAAGAKVVLVGDRRQLPEIEAGGAFAALARRVPAWRLSVNRRQVETWEQEALAAFRSGRVDDALAAYEDHGRVITAGTAAEVRAQMVADWWAAHVDGQHAMMLAGRHADVDALNALARARMVEHGRLRGPELIAGDRLFQAGDRVLALKNNYRVGLRNGTCGSVIAIDANARHLQVMADTGNVVTVPAAYLDAGHLAHGYAMTVHKAQGLTADRALLLGSDDLYFELGYVGLSRGRVTNHLYLVDGDRDEVERGTSIDRDGPADEVRRALSTSRAKRLAVDQLDPANTLGSLHRERDLLRLTMSQAGPDPSRGIAAAAKRIEETKARLANERERLDRILASRSAWRRLRNTTDPAVEAQARHVAAANDDLADARRELERLNSRKTEREAFLFAHEPQQQRLEQLEAAVEAAMTRRMREVAADPPPYLRTRLGDVPAEAAERRIWFRAVRAVETYRAAAGIDHDSDALGPDLPGRYDSARDEAEYQLANAETVLRPPTAEPPQHMPEPAIELGIEL